ncbi:helix-turn-helix transcriptional regulator [Actinoplanes derwentensis]|uniref:Helix-turn-helix domain-containing protein n=1 Tax=Actinoplanes derwentensis TaxID=113562 RepID=A0A1H1Z4M7_9ACTN|nr:helix-turn-helix transcriptional regulator [Actinoplanes derwentensis]GID81423.1 transcriptional regulator [Actinoplanes derwentensis]SDT28512.1 Helix-turn-helix domain-containing protein [Actinoplanes derwentensis]
MPTTPADNELGRYLRTRRESTPPAVVGLPAGPRRRTPGLRRAELATLAGMSVEYLTRLEQGRDRRPSPEVLNALATALRFTLADREHLRFLGKALAGVMCPSGHAPATEVRPTVRALLDRLEPGPAMVLNRLGDVLAATKGYQDLMRPLGLLDDRRVNVIRWHFVDDRARAACPDWAALADEHVAWLKTEVRRGDRHAIELAGDLTVLAGGEFAGRMAAPSGPAARAGVERMAHPEAGRLALAFEILELPDADEQRLVVYLPADAATTAVLDRLAVRRPGVLRAV